MFYAAPRSRQSSFWLGPLQRPLLLSKHSSVIADPVQAKLGTEVINLGSFPPLPLDADAAYGLAIEFAKKQGLKLPMV